MNLGQFKALVAPYLKNLKEEKDYCCSSVKWPWLQSPIPQKEINKQINNKTLRKIVYIIDYTFLNVFLVVTDR